MTKTSPPSPSDLAILVLNVGSSSLRLSLYDFLTLAPISHASIEKQEARSFETELGDILRHNLAPAFKVRAIGCRVVHGGPVFTMPTLIDPEVLSTIRALSDLAPLHNPAALKAIEVCRSIFIDLPIVAVFDTGFHQSIPRLASTYAIPESLSKAHGLQRYGFHGIAHQYVSERLTELLRSNDRSGRLITCHLGNGASICAIKNGQSIDTSMGFTPMEGLIMGTRSGDIDPGLLLHLMLKLDMSPAQVYNMLNKQSGLLGLSELSADLRDLERAADRGEEQAEFAMQCFAYRATKYIGAYAAILNGVDGIAFSGGIGENSAAMRARICSTLSFLGIELDVERNIKAKGAGAECISSADSRVPVWVIHADETLQIARETRRLIGKD